MLQSYHYLLLGACRCPDERTHNTLTPTKFQMSSYHSQNINACSTVYKIIHRETVCIDPITPHHVESRKNIRENK